MRVNPPLLSPLQRQTILGRIHCLTLHPLHPPPSGWRPCSSCLPPSPPPPLVPPLCLPPSLCATPIKRRQHPQKYIAKQDPKKSNKKKTEKTTTTKSNYKKTKVHEICNQQPTIRLMRTRGLSGKEQRGNEKAQEENSCRNAGIHTRRSFFLRHAQVVECVAEPCSHHPHLSPSLCTAACFSSLPLHALPLPSGYPAFCSMFPLLLRPASLCLPKPLSTRAPLSQR